MLVHPRVNGKDVGWFILDTGSSACTIAAAAAGAAVEGFWFGGSGAAPAGPVAATFARPGDAPSKSLDDVDGLVGMGFLRDHVLFMDEARSRVAIGRRGAK